MKVVFHHSHRFHPHLKERGYTRVPQTVCAYVCSPLIPCFAVPCARVMFIKCHLKILPTTSLTEFLHTLDTFVALVVPCFRRTNNVESQTWLICFFLILDPRSLPQICSSKSLAKSRSVPAWTLFIFIAAALMSWVWHCSFQMTVGTEPWNKLILNDQYTFYPVNVDYIELKKGPDF